MNLYEISTTYRNLMQAIEDGEMTMEEAADTLEGMDGMLEDKLENCVKWMRGQVAEADAYDAEIKRLSDKKNACAKRADWMKEYIRSAMKRSGKDKVKTSIASISLGKPSVRCIITDSNALPDDLFELVHKPLTAEIKKRLEAGESVAGAELEQGEPRLTIR